MLRNTRTLITTGLLLGSSMALAQPHGGILNLDSDGDGRVSFEEFRLPPRHRGPMPFERADSDEDGAVSRDEMISAFAAGQDEREQRMMEHFDSLDEDGNGVVSQNEIRRQVFDRMDADGDGYVTEEEAQAARGKRQQRRHRGSHENQG